jgi:mono/diheme cytochrome c family protein
MTRPIHVLLGLAAFSLAACDGGAHEQGPPPASMGPSPYAEIALTPPAPPPSALAAAGGAAAGPKVNLHDAGPPGDADKGKAHFTKVCQPCHQADGRGLNGMLAADLAGDPTRLAQPDSVLLNHITNGFKGKKLVMPPQGGVLTAEQIKDALAYVRKRFGKKP